MSVQMGIIRSDARFIVPCFDRWESVSTAVIAGGGLRQRTIAGLRWPLWRHRVDGCDSVVGNGRASSALNAQAEAAFLPSLNPAPELARGIL